MVLLLFIQIIRLRINESEDGKNSENTMKFHNLYFVRKLNHALRLVEFSPRVFTGVKKKANCSR